MKIGSVSDILSLAFSVMIFNTLYTCIQARPHHNKHLNNDSIDTIKREFRRLHHRSRDANRTYCKESEEDNINCRIEAERTATELGLNVEPWNKTGHYHSKNRRELFTKIVEALRFYKVLIEDIAQRELDYQCRLERKINMTCEARCTNDSHSKFKQFCNLTKHTLFTIRNIRVNLNENVDAPDRPNSAIESIKEDGLIFNHRDYGMAVLHVFLRQIHFIEKALKHH